MLNSNDFPISVTQNTDKSVFKRESQSMKLFLRKYLNCLDQDDPELIKIMKKKYIKKPSKMQYKISDEIKLKVEEGLGEYKQDKILDALLFQGKTLEGFLIEAGFIEIIICLSERCITSNLDG